MKKISVWKKDNKIRTIDKAFAIDNWTSWQKPLTYSVPIDTPIKDSQPIMEILTENPEYNFQISVVNSQPEKWVKEGEEDRLEQPMVPERWSDGITTVYSEEEVPQVDGAPDVDFVYFPETQDDSWDYISPIDYSWQISYDEDEIAIKKEEEEFKTIVRNAISFGQSLLVDFAAENIKLGITQDGMTKTVREVMSNVTNAIVTGSLYDAIAEIDAIPAESKDDKYITDYRLNQYKQRIQEYLGI